MTRVFRTLEEWILSQKNQPVEASLRILGLLVGLFGVVSFFVSKLGSLVGLLAVASGIMIFVLVQFAVIKRTATELDKELSGAKTFIGELVGCLDEATKQLSLLYQFKSLEMVWSIEPNGDLYLSDTFEFSAGPSSGPIYLLKWEFAVDEYNPAIKSVSDINARAKCLKPEHVSFHFKPRMKNDRTVILYFLFPEGVGSETRKFACELTWPGYFEHFLKTGSDAISFTLDPSKPWTIDELIILMKLPPGELGKLCYCSGNHEEGDFVGTTPEEQALAGGDIAKWVIPSPQRGKTYEMTVECPSIMSR